MKTKNEHFGEHSTYPAGKMLPVESSNEKSPTIKKEIKKIHNRRSRQFLKRELTKEIT